MHCPTPPIPFGNYRRTILALTLITAFTSLGLTACGSKSGSKPSTTSPSDSLTARGVVTGFGSVFVNGVEWEIDAADIEIDDESGLESELEIGMRVDVFGTISADGTTGMATNVAFDADMEGPIESLTPIGNDGDQIEISVLGKSVIIDKSSTTFGEDDVAFTFGTMAVGDLVEVSGLLDTTGAIAATRIEKNGTLVMGTSEVEFKGTVENFAGGNTFDVNGVTVTFDPTGTTTDLLDIPGGVANGDYVEVEGVLETASTVTASEIDAEDEGLGDDIGDAELEGYVGSLIGASDFMVSGQSVDASSAILVPDNSALLVDGAKVKIEGTVVGDVLVADTVEFRGNYVRISAEISMLSDIDLTENTVTLLGVVVTVDNSTRLKDDTGNLEFQGLAYLAAGDFLEVRGYPDGQGGMMATRLELEVDSSDEVELRGLVDSFDAIAKTITILGLTVPTDGTTDFEGSDDNTTTEAAFYAALAVGDLVELEGDKDEVDKSILTLAVEAEFEDK